MSKALEQNPEHIGIQSVVERVAVDVIPFEKLNQFFTSNVKNRNPKSTLHPTKSPDDPPGFYSYNLYL